MTETQDFRGLIRIVGGDIQTAYAKAQGEPGSAEVRAAVRAIFAGVEAVVWYAKALALNAIALTPENYTSFEFQALRDRTYIVRENGMVHERPNFIPLGTSLRLIGNLLARSQLSNADFTQNSKDALIVKRSLAVRHRLTHPKSAADLEVTEADLRDAMLTWAVVLTLGLNTALEADKRMGTGMFPIRKPDPVAPHQ